MFSSTDLKKIVKEARPLIEQQLDLAEKIAGLRTVVTDNGGDWSQLKALVKAQIQDERDDSGDGEHIARILKKADYAKGYADMLGWGNLNEFNISGDEEIDPETGEILDTNTARETLASTTAADPAGEADEASSADQAEPSDAAVTEGNDLREPLAAAAGQILREGDAPLKADAHVIGEVLLQQVEHPESNSEPGKGTLGAKPSMACERAFMAVAAGGQAIVHQGQVA